MNRVIVAGHLGKDIDIRVGERGVIEGEISIALNDYIGNDGSGKAKYWTTWVTAVIFGERARALQDAMYSGRFVTVGGQLRTVPYKVNETKTLQLTYIKVEDIDFDRTAVPKPQEHS